MLGGIVITEDDEVTGGLHQLLQPFLLRRVKSEVCVRVCVCVCMRTCMCVLQHSNTLKLTLHIIC